MHGRVNINSTMHFYQVNLVFDVPALPSISVPPCFNVYSLIFVYSMYSSLGDVILPGRFVTFVL